MLGIFASFCLSEFGERAYFGANFLLQDGRSQKSQKPLGVPELGIGTWLR